MPSAIEYIPPTDIRRNQFNTEVITERTNFRNRYRLAVQYYLGQQEKPLIIEDPDEDPDDNTMINLVQMTADRTVSFLFPDVPRVDLDPASVDDTPEEIWVKDFFAANGGLQSLIKLGLRGFLAGEDYIRLKPVPKRFKNDPERFPTMTVLDPTAITIYWRADDVGSVIWYEMRYVAGTTVIIEDFVHREETDDWIIYKYQAEPQNTVDFTGAPTQHGMASNVFGLDFLNFTTDWPFELVDKAIHTSSIPPIIEFPHLPHPDDRHGLSEFTQKDLQDTINRIASERNRIVRENSDPVDVVTGTDPEDVQATGNLLTISEAGAKVTRLEMKGDMAGATAVLDKLIEVYLAIARVVLLKGEAKDLQRVTNASVRTLFLDALSKNAVLQSSYGAGLQKLVKLALEMAFEQGVINTNPSTLKPIIKFAEPLPVDQTEIANINAIAVNGGWRSLRTAATKGGDDWAFETAAKETEQQAADERALKEGEIAAQNAKALSDAVPPAPVAPGGAKPGFPKK